MPEVTSFAPGNFCWAELVTSDANSAKEFYTKLFGWTANDQPMGPDQFYTMLQLGGKNVGALYGMNAEQLGRGVPVHWNLYVSVESADQSANKAASLGASITMPPFDVMDAGRMAAIHDPGGAPIMLWQAKNHHGASVTDEPGAFCWYELTVNDTDAAKSFYNGLFGWEAGGHAHDGDTDHAYIEFTLGKQHIAGMMKILPEWGNVPPAWTGYINVANCDETARNCSALGGKVLTAPTDIPEATGRFAILQDPQSAVIGLYQSNRK
jgi:predicted enzyme related to lactoylglutathione lyase